MLSRKIFPKNFFHFSEEALRPPSAFVYFAVVSLLVQTACKTFCSKKWNSMLVPAAKQFVPQTSFKSTSSKSSLDNLAELTAVQIFDNEPITDRFPP